MTDLAATDTSLAGILARDGLRSLFQPIVDLETGRLFGYETLVRGPPGSPLERPDRLFGAARTEDRLAELDAACQAIAVSSATPMGSAHP